MNEQLDRRTLEEYADAYAIIHTRIKDDLWSLADICAAVTTHYGEADVWKFIMLLDGFGIGIGKTYFYELARTSRTFENSARVESLSFSHFRTAARTTDPLGWVEVAADNNFSVRQLESKIAETKEIEQGFPVADPPKQEIVRSFETYTIEIKVAAENWQEFQSAIELIESEQTSVSAFLFNRIMEFGRKGEKENGQL